MGTTRRKPHRGPDHAEGRQLGLDGRDIPGGLNHLASAESPPSKVAAPAQGPWFDGGLAHGVYDPVTEPGWQKPQGEQPGPLPQPVFETLPPGQDAVPVYIVEHGGRQRVRRDSMCRTLTVAAQGGDPTRLCSTDRDRVCVQVLHEGLKTDGTASTDYIRAGSLTEVTEGGGSLLKPGATSYLKLATQGELWALSWNGTGTGAAVLASVILETEISE